MGEPRTQQYHDEGKVEQKQAPLSHSALHDIGYSSSSEDSPQEAEPPAAIEVLIHEGSVVDVFNDCDGSQQHYYQHI